MESYQSDSELTGHVVDSHNDRDRRELRFKFAVEIPLLFVMFAVGVTASPLENLIMYRTCVHPLGHPVTICRSFLEPDSINHTIELEKEVQQYTTYVTTVKSVLDSLGPAILSLFIGVWSDKHGRKPLLAWSAFGMTLSAMLTVVYSMLSDFGPWWIIATGVPSTLVGGFCTMVTATLCYINDVTSKVNRSFWLMIIQITVSVSVAAGKMICPYLLKAVGTVYLLLIVTALYTFGYAFINIIIEESMRNVEQGSVKTVFNFSHLKEMARACFETKPNYGRSLLLLPVGVSSLSIFTIYGSNELMYLFTRAKIHWTMEDFSTFTSISSLMWLLGSFFGVAVVQRVFRISDLNFIVISLISCMAEYTIKAFAMTTWHMYFGSAISLFGTTSGTLLRSFLSKTIPATDVAKVFGLISSTESICPLISPFVYNALYASTITTFPGSFMLLSTAINIVGLSFILTVQYLRKKTASQTYQPIEAES